MMVNHLCVIRRLRRRLESLLDSNPSIKLNNSINITIEGKLSEIEGSTAEEGNTAEEEQKRRKREYYIKTFRDLTHFIDNICNKQLSKNNEYYDEYLFTLLYSEAYGYKPVSDKIKNIISGALYNKENKRSSCFR